MDEVTLATLAAQISKLIERVDALEHKLGGRIDSVDQKLAERIDAVDRKLGDQILAVERKLDAATGGGKLTLAYLAKQQDKVLREQAAMRAELRTHTAALTRLDSSVQGLTGEIRAQGERQQVQDKLWRNMEDRVFALEER